MRKLKNSYVRIAIILLMVLSLAGPSFNASASPLASHPTIGLGTATSFSVLAGTDVNDTNPSVVTTGDVGLHPATGAQIDITCGEVVSGTIYDRDGNYVGDGDTSCRTTDNGLLNNAKVNLTTAYNEAAGRTATGDPGTELGGDTLIDGTYETDSGTFEINGTLTLDGEGNAGAVFIFNMDSTLVTGSDSTVSLINGAQACNVFWRVGSSATLGTNSTFVGTIMAEASITDDGGATINGRLLAQSGAVTLNDTTITRSDCVAAPPEEEEEEEEDVVTGLPDTGGAPIRNEDSAWTPLIVGGFSVAALALGVRAYRRTQLPKQ